MAEQAKKVITTDEIMRRVHELDELDSGSLMPLILSLASLIQLRARSNVVSFGTTDFYLMAVQGEQLAAWLRQIMDDFTEAALDASPTTRLTKGEYDAPSEGGPDHG